MNQGRRGSRTRTTIRGVSKLSGVSVGTVSNVINTPDLVAERTRLKVEQAIRDLGYTPTAAARSLKSRRSFLVGYPIYHSVPASVMGDFFHELVVRAEAHGLGVLSMAYEPGDHEAAFSRLWDAEAVDGFLLSEVSENDPRVLWLLEHDVPFAAFGRAVIDTPYNCVDLDITSGMRKVAAHVVDLGHRDIAFVGWNLQPTNRFRHLGAEQELADRSMKLMDTLETEFSIDGGYQAGSDLLDRAVPPTAIVCTHDIIAAGVIRAANERDIPVGGTELMVTGFDDIPLAQATTPRLTSVRFPLGEVAHHCVELLANRLDDAEANAMVYVQPELVIRESTGFQA